MSITRYLTDRAWSGEIFLLIVARTEDALIFKDEIDLLKKRFPNLRVWFSLTRIEPDNGWNGQRGRMSQDWLAQAVPDLPRRLFYVCGPDAMMSSTRALLIKLGVPESKIRFEAFVSPGAALRFGGIGGREWRSGENDSSGVSTVVDGGNLKRHGRYASDCDVRPIKKNGNSDPRHNHSRSLGIGGSQSPVRVPFGRLRPVQSEVGRRFGHDGSRGRDHSRRKKRRLGASLPGPCPRRRHRGCLKPGRVGLVLGAI